MDRMSPRDQADGEPARRGATKPFLSGWQRSLLGQRLSQGAALLLLLYGSGLLASLLPLALRDPGWYLSATDRLVANAPILITAACLWWLSQAIASPPPIQLSWPRAFFRRIHPRRQLLLDPHAIVQRLSAGFFGLYLLVIPVELVAGTHLVVQIQISHTASLRQLQARQTLIGQRIQAAVTIDDLEALLQPGSRTATGDIPVLRRKQDLNLALRTHGRQLLATMTQQKQQRLTRLVTDMLRVILVALPLALFFRALSRSTDPNLGAVDRYLR